ncbi:hypothetical protein DM02DRAFT_650514 [Periconia macrospinosa]|uniref:Uncharacterized protein n=1 Tax=Periconia macrospinosa TaxID=97972 RepID=A0A2V1E867_9PLEO|nr:hypothetical protein DM02DRAFT_650514 [Periconia macrospinosa]
MATLGRPWGSSSSLTCLTPHHHLITIPSSTSLLLESNLDSVCRDSKHAFELRFSICSTGIAVVCKYTNRAELSSSACTIFMAYLRPPGTQRFMCRQCYLQSRLVFTKRSEVEIVDDINITLPSLVVTAIRRRILVASRVTSAPLKLADILQAIGNQRGLEPCTQLINELHEKHNIDKCYTAGNNFRGMLKDL